MADYNTVPEGRAGTGAAFLLGTSRALQNWIGQDKQNRAVMQANAAAQDEYDQNVNQSYSKNGFKGVSGQLWNAEVQGKIDEHLNQGAQYRAQGIDIYNPNFRDKAQVEAHNVYMQDRAKLNSMLEAQKAFQKDADAQQALLSKEGEYAFTPESRAAADVNAFEKNNKLYDAVTKGVKYPTLERVFDYNKNIKSLLKPLTTEVTKVVGNERITEKEANVPAIIASSKNLLANGPNRNWVEKQIGGSMEGLLGTTDMEAIKKSLDNEFRSPNGIEIIAELKNKGKVPSFDSPEYAKFLEDAAKEQLKAEEKYDKILSNVVQDGIGLANPNYKKINDFSLANERRNQEKMGMARERLNMERERLAHQRKGWTQKEIDEAPDGIATNVVTNIATTQQGGKVVQRPSTSLSTTNVGNAKTPFLPQNLFDPSTGLSIQNSSQRLISGGQVHIKPVLYFKGGQKILDDESLAKLRAGTYKLKIGNKEQTISPDADVRYDELLYGDEKLESDPKNPDSKARIQKVIIPITGQSLDKKFDKAYNREKMFDSAIRSTKDFETKKSIIKQQLKLQVPNMPDSELDRLAFDTAKQY